MSWSIFSHSRYGSIKQEQENNQNECLKNTRFFYIESESEEKFGFEISTLSRTENFLIKKCFLTHRRISKREKLLALHEIVCNRGSSRIVNVSFDIADINVYAHIYTHAHIATSCLECARTFSAYYRVSRSILNRGKNTFQSIKAYSSLWNLISGPIASTKIISHLFLYSK